jgi:hypothetical protein
MENVVLISESKSELTILLNLAKKLGIKTYRLTNEEVEDLGLVNAMKDGRTGEYIDVDNYLKTLRKK